MFTNKIKEMEDGKDKELMKILEDKAMPFIRKCDGYAVKVEEDKEIKYKDYNEQELTLKVPAGSYIVVREDRDCPQIITAECFDYKNKFVEGEKPKMKKEDDSHKIGMASMTSKLDYNSDY